MSRKIIFIILLIVIAVGTMAYFAFVKKVTPYSTKEKCELATGKECYLFQGLCQVMEAQNQEQAEENEKFLKDCLPKIGTWQPIETASQNSNTSETQNYYNTLVNECKSKQSESCCLASVEAMRAGNYTLAPQEGCPAGYQPNMMKCIDSFKWCQPAEKSTNNIHFQSAPFSLDFFAGGSIFGSSFEVKISGDIITYRETTQGVSKEIKKFERVLLPAEYSDIYKTVADTKLVNLQSQDFTKEPLVPDQASYRITVLLDGKENIIHCGIPLSGTQSTNNCQKQIDKLRLKLNSILDVNIY